MKAKWKICPICRGDGKHVNPDIDSHGISAEEFAEDPDFAEDYHSGLYDVACKTCEGTGKVLTSELAGKMERLEQGAADRRLAMQEDGIFEAGVSDYRYGY